MKLIGRRTVDRIKAYQEGMPIKNRVILSLCLVFMVILPVVALSLYYIDGIRKTMGRIRIDEEVIRAAKSVELNVLKAKEAEEDYLLRRESTSVKAYRNAVESAIGKLESTPEIANREQDMVKKIIQKLKEYSLDFDALVSASDREAWDIQTQYLADQIAESQRTYDALLLKARTAATPEERSRLSGEAREYANSLDYLIMDALKHRSPRQKPLITGFGEKRENILTLVSQIVTRSSSEELENNNRIDRLSARATRNIITTLIITVLIGIYLITRLPKSIVKPIRRITSIIKQAEDGNLDVSVEMSSKDEVGELARFLNRLLAHLNTLDKLKSQKIYAIHNQLKLIVNQLEAWVILVDAEGRIAYLNDKAQRELQRDMGELIGKPLWSLPLEGELGARVKDALRSHETVSNLEVKVKVNEQIHKLIGWFEVVCNQEQKTCGGVLFLAHKG